MGEARKETETERGIETEKERERERERERENERERDRQRERDRINCSHAVSKVYKSLSKAFAERSEFVAKFPCK